MEMKLSVGDRTWPLDQDVADLILNAAQIGRATHPQPILQQVSSDSIFR